MDKKLLTLPIGVQSFERLRREKRVSEQAEHPAPVWGGGVEVEMLIRKVI